MKTSFKPVLIPVLAGLIGLSASGLAHADHSHDRARVIRSTPIVEQVSRDGATPLVVIDRPSAGAAHPELVAADSNAASLGADRP